MTSRSSAVAQALMAAADALKLAGRELDRTGPDRWNWAAVGLVAALQGALVAGLQGYDTSRPEDVTDPSWPERYAPVSLLLRRAGSAQYLAPPEQLQLPGSVLRALERVLSFRNDLLHAKVPEISDGMPADCGQVMKVLQHLLILHPAFRPEEHVLVLTTIREAIGRIERQLAAAG